MANENNFQIIIDHLLETGIPENDLGDALFKISDQAIEEKQFTAAIAILNFLVQALEDQSEAPRLLKKIGDIYILISAFDKAREYYGKLPLTLDNIKLCLEIYTHTIDIEGLLSLRDTILNRVKETDREKIHSLTNEAVLKIYAAPPILNSHVNLCKDNIACLKGIYPFSQDISNYNDLFSFDPSQIAQTKIIKISDHFYTKQDDIWSKSFSIEDIQEKRIEQNGSDIILHCNSFESFSDFINLIKTNKPEFIKKECRVIIDFKILWQAITVINLSPLINCDFVIRFIEKKHLKSQLTHLLLERKLPVADRVIYFSKDDPDFFSQFVNPILIDCEKIVLDKIDQLEKYYSQLFPKDYQSKVIEKIRTGQKLNILLCTSRYTTYLQHSTRDIATGFEQLGHNTLIQVEDEDAGMGNRKDVTIENLINFKPDIIFAINHLRCSTFPWFPKSIPFVTWIQDLMPHLINLDDPHLITNCDHIFSFSKAWILNFFGNHAALSGKKIHLLPIPANPNIYFPLKIKKKYDVTYISHIHHPDTTLIGIEDCKNGLPEWTDKNSHIFLQKVVKAIEGMPMDALSDMYSSHKNHLSFAKKICDDVDIPFNDNLFKLIKSIDDEGNPSRFHRHFLFSMKAKPIIALLQNGIDLKLFGMNWDKYPNFKENSLGSVKNGKDLNILINETRINLNISPGTSYHMKVPEVIATKSFMLTRKIEEDTMPIDKLFETDKEIILFKNENDLIKIIEFYLSNREEREKVEQAAYNKLLSHYTVKKAASFILEKINSTEKSKQHEIF